MTLHYVRWIFFFAAVAAVIVGLILSIPSDKKFATKNSNLLILLGQLLLLLAALKINKNFADHAPAFWLIVPVFLAAAMARASFTETEKPVLRLWQLIGSVSALYALLYYPLMPLTRSSSASVTIGLYALVLCFWLVSMVCGAMCFKIPSLSVLPASFLVWSKSSAEYITGLPIRDFIDCMPLSEISVCIGFGLLIGQIYSRYGGAIYELLGGTNTPTNIEFQRKQFVQLLLLISIGIHLANYFWSFHAKITLDGPPLAWLSENNPVSLFIVEVNNGYIFYSGQEWLVRLVLATLNKTYLLSNLWILAIQGVAVTAFFLPNRALFIVLLLLDAMHVAIILLAGANFWPWILLNVIIAYIVASRYFVRPSFFIRVLGTTFILIAPDFVNVTKLGWYDTGAYNRLFFEAIDDEGRRHAVPTNFFTFYAAPMALMDYGTPEPETALATRDETGDTRNYDLFKAGRSCDMDKLRRVGAKGWDARAGTDGEKLADFVQSYHKLALKIYSILGAFPYYNFYPHHFYIRKGLTADFDELDKRRIVAYIYRRESMCFRYENGEILRDVKATAEYRIDVAGDSAGARDGR